jgi:cytochrome c
MNLHAAHALTARRCGVECVRLRLIAKDGRLMTKLIAACAALLACVGTAAAQDISAGENSFKKCLPCHAVGEGAKNKVGPVLNGLEGRKAGTVEGFSYSDANKNSGITWNEAQFKEYIKDPKAKVPGTKMIYAGLKDEKRVSDLVAYLKQFDASGKKAE